ncbi:MAG: hypothetical protein J5I90_12390 [Caldilineales bacterium]|nr:hypothetical protein [Caldilineales bacterium]
MVRTQIQLTEEQSRKLKSLASKKGMSVAELIRVGVDSLLRHESDIDMAERRRRAIAAAGCAHSDITDLAAQHDRYLAEAYES